MTSHRYKGASKTAIVLVLVSRDSGNGFRFPDSASHTGRFCLIFVHISSVVSFRVDMNSGVCLIRGLSIYSIV